MSDGDLDGVSMRNISKELKGLSRISDEKEREVSHYPRLKNHVLVI